MGRSSSGQSIRLDQVLLTEPGIFITQLPEDAINDIVCQAVNTDVVSSIGPEDAVFVQVSLAIELWLFTLVTCPGLSLDLIKYLRPCTCFLQVACMSYPIWVDSLGMQTWEGTHWDSLRSSQNLGSGWLASIYGKQNIARTGTNRVSPHGPKGRDRRAVTEGP